MQGAIDDQQLRFLLPSYIWLKQHLFGSHLALGENMYSSTSLPGTQYKLLLQWGLWSKLVICHLSNALGKVRSKSSSEKSCFGIQCSSWSFLCSLIQKFWKKTSKKEIVCGNHFLVGKTKMRKTMNVEHFFSMSVAMRQLLWIFWRGDNLAMPVSIESKRYLPRGQLNIFRLGQNALAFMSPYCTILTTVSLYLFDPTGIGCIP